MLRVLGRGPAAVVYLADLLKGLVASLIGLLVWGPAVGAPGRALYGRGPLLPGLAPVPGR